MKAENQFILEAVILANKAGNQCILPYCAFKNNPEGYHQNQLQQTQHSTHTRGAFLGLDLGLGPKIGVKGKGQV